MPHASKRHVEETPKAPVNCSEAGFMRLAKPKQSNYSNWTMKKWYTRMGPQAPSFLSISQSVRGNSVRQDSGKLRCLFPKRYATTSVIRASCQRSSQSVLLNSTSKLAAFCSGVSSGQGSWKCLQNSGNSCTNLSPNRGGYVLKLAATLS